MDSALTDYPNFPNSKQKQSSPNDIHELKSVAQLESVALDLYSPRLRKACMSLGIPLRDLVRRRKTHFMEKGVSDDVVELRYKHF